MVFSLKHFRDEIFLEVIYGLYAVLKKYHILGSDITIEIYWAHMYLTISYLSY